MIPWAVASCVLCENLSLLVFFLMCESTHTEQGVCMPVFFMPVFACGYLRRGSLEPVVMWCREDDNHSGRLNNSDQHCDHPSLGMEQLHLRRRPQAEVPLLHGAEEHHRLSEVPHLMNTLCTSTSRWTIRAITSSVEWAHKYLHECCLWRIL